MSRRNFKLQSYGPGAGEVQQALDTDIDGTLQQEFAKSTAMHWVPQKILNTRTSEIDKAVADADAASSAAQEQAQAIQDAEKDISSEKSTAETERAKLTDEVYKWQ